MISIGTTRPISRIHRRIAVLHRKGVELNADKSKIEKENHWKTALCFARTHEKQVTIRREIR